MKHLQIKIVLSFILGLITTGVSYYIKINGGDYIARGFPAPYLNSVWGMGYSPWRFSWVAALLDIFIWGLIWFIFIKIIFWIRKKYIA